MDGRAEGAKDGDGRTGRGESRERAKCTLGGENWDNKMESFETTVDTVVTVGTWAMSEMT
jgi:hypothetical protein